LRNEHGVIKHQLHHKVGSDDNKNERLINAFKLFWLATALIRRFFSLNSAISVLVINLNKFASKNFIDLSKLTLHLLPFKYICIIHDKKNAPDNLENSHSHSCCFIEAIKAQLQG
jgi:hypothetical protein